MKDLWKRIDGKARAKHPEIWKIFLFLVAGLIANVPELGTQYACLYGFRAAGVSNLGIFSFMEKIVEPNTNFTLATVVFAYMISTAVGYTIAFIVNRKATFQANSNVALSTFLYVLMVIFTIFANGLFVGPFVDKLVGFVSLPDGVAIGVSKFLCMMIPGLWTYPLNRFVIHRVKKEAAPAQAEEAKEEAAA